ncbi:hypothetical protein ABI_36120 [Asticcacaulis biprosthecium C19]|uniref:Uncharacterized protein n=1 Tax=Asticcacaulis biprosthecium C19 TaxID=715226 RepID=F4QQV0_9CAUL|nr:hypothetical protein ABI_36120 [Asticcacaulis biprosthecium C19]
MQSARGLSGLKKGGIDAIRLVVLGLYTARRDQETCQMAFKGDTNFGKIALKLTIKLFRHRFKGFRTNDRFY